MNAVIERFVEPDERVQFRMVEVDGVSDESRIVAIEYKIAFPVLESLGDWQFVPDAQKKRPCVMGQTGEEAPPKRREIQVLISDDRGHAGPAVSARYSHSIDCGFVDA